MTRTRMRARGAVVAVALTLAASLALAATGRGAHAQGSARRAALSGGLAVSGNTLINTATGQPVQLRGVNRSGTEYACIQGWGIFDGPSDDASVAAIASWGANVVRVPLNEDCWLGINGAPAAYSGSTYRQAIVSYVNLLHAHGMYAELSLIWGAPGSYQATYQPGAPDEDHSPAMWASLASTFKTDAAVVLAPWGETIVDWNCFLNGGVCEATYGPNNTPYNTAGMQQAVNVMRGAGYTGVISIPCIDYANDCTDAPPYFGGQGGGDWLTHEPSDPNHNLIAEAHVYGKNTCDTTACLDATIGNQTGSVPFIFGETGETYDGSDCNNSSSYISTFMTWADAHNVGYEAWTWDTWGSCNLSLITNYNGTPYGVYGTYVRQHLLARAGGGGGGGSPSASFSPTSLSFGNQQVGTTSAAQTLTLSNTGGATLTISGISIGGADSGDFAQINTCGSSLAAGGSCAISVTFTPGAVGSRGATVSVSDNAAGSPQQATLTGTGVTSAPAVSLTPSGLSFGNQQVGTTSAPQSVTLKNTGNAPLSISGIGLTGANAGDFGQTNTCGSSVAAGATCAISVTFAPQSTGGKSAAVSVSDNAAGSPQSVALSGTGVAPGGAIFGDGFESGNFSAWSATSASSGDSVTVESSSAHSGTYAMLAHKARGSGGNAKVEKAFAPQSQLDIRAYFDLTNLSGHGEVNILSQYSQDGYFLGWVEIVANAQTHYAHLYYYTGTYHQYDCGAAPSLGAWHSIEAQDIVSGSGEGGFTVWVDGAQRCTASGISNAEQTNAKVACAMFGSDTSERNVGLDVYVDDVKIAQGYIGM